MKRSLRIALCQINTIPGDIPGNVARIREVAGTVASLGADLAVFPEMAIVGYSPRDLLFRRRFVEAAEAALRELAAGVEEVPLLVGTVRRREGPGRPFANCAALLEGGAVRAIVDKVLLPDYDVFDEARYFEPGEGNGPIDFRGTLLGVTVCEDIWVVPQTPDVPIYAQDPARELVRQGAEVIVNLSASPYHQGKPADREQLVCGTAERLGRPVLLVNLWGGNDEIVFDGSSCAADPNGTLTHRAVRFADDIVLVDVPPAGQPAPDVSDQGTAELQQALICGIRDYARKCGFTKAVVGLSGGIDSAVTACLVADALGAENVTGVTMPSEFSSEGSVLDARSLAEQNGITFHVAPVAEAYETLRASALGVVGEGPFGIMEENIQARVRGLLLMAVSNRTGALVVTTGNKSELAVGYCTLYGDMCGGLAALSDVYKTDVYRIARRYHAAGRLPLESIEKPPSAELRPDQKDEDSLPPYDLLDRILTLHVDRNLGVHGILDKIPDVDRDTVERIVKLVARNEYKRQQAAPGIRVSTKAFGFGRRVPIVAANLGFLDGSA